MGIRMKDKVVLVTGAGSCDEGWKNGKAAVVLYVCQGAQVFWVGGDLVTIQNIYNIIISAAVFHQRVKWLMHGIQPMHRYF